MSKSILFFKITHTYFCSSSSKVNQRQPFFSLTGNRRAGQIQFLSSRPAVRRRTNRVRMIDTCPSERVRPTARTALRHRVNKQSREKNRLISAIATVTTSIQLSFVRSHVTYVDILFVKTHTEHAHNDCGHVYLFIFIFIQL